MPTLRAMLDNKTVSKPAPKASKPSPVAQSVSETVQDPYGKTKDQFSTLSQKKMEYELAREEMHRQLAPVQSVLDHVGQIHDLNYNGIPDEQEGLMNSDNPDVGPDGRPVNMGQTPGQMNMNRPSQSGFRPGVAPGMPQKSVVPNKMGMPAPGGKPTNMAGPSAFNKPAAPPKGAGKMPGANGPGAKKPAGATNKAQNNSSRQVKVHVTANSANTLLSGAQNNLQANMGLGRLKSEMGLQQKSNTKGSNLAYNPVVRAGKTCKACGKMHAGKCMKSGGPMGGPGMSGNPGPQGGPGAVGKPLTAGGPGSGRRPGTGERARYLKDQLKRSDDSLINRPGKTKTAPAYGSPEWRKSWSDFTKKEQAGQERDRAANYKDIEKRSARKGGWGHGTSIGAKKGWSTRGKGHLSKTEKAAHYATMNSGK